MFLESTLWNDQDFSVIQILREINFRGCRSSKHAIFGNFKGCDCAILGEFSLSKVLKFIKIKIQNLKMF